MMLPFFEGLEKWLGNAREKSGLRLNPWPIVILGIVLLAMSYLFMPAQVAFALSLALFIAPVWLPLLLLGGAWTLWVILRRSLFIEKQKRILLEIRPPRSLEKTPLAMETVLSGLHLGSDGNWYEKYFLGKTRPWWSLEIVSLEGQVHFFIWTLANFRKIIESQIYSQYPGAQVAEVEDYTKSLSATPEEWAIWGCDFVHTNTKVAVPIKTYVEYGLDKVQKEPEQVDPLANLIEFMGSIGKGEFLWFQMMIRTHKGDIFGNKKNKEGKQYTWKDEADELIDKIRKDTRSPYIDPASGKEMAGFPNPTKGQSELMAAIERNVSKLGFDVGARGVYLAHPEHFNPINITGLTGMFKQFSAEKPWNGIRPAHWMTEFNDYPWELGIDRLKNNYRRGLIEAYRRRQFFHDPFKTPGAMVMSTEELATLYHIPSRAVETPTLPRIQSATSEAPSNLPV